MKTSLFIDTNIFLHYKLFTSINWQKLVGSSEITIVIPPIIIRELNKIKDTSPNKNIRDRAKKALIELSKIFEGEIILSSSSNVEFKLEDRDSNINFADYDLLFRVNDDQLIASILMQKNENPNYDTLLITSDYGLALMSKAKRFDINCIKIPKEYQLPNKLDSDERKIRSLEKEILEMKALVPKLGLTFINGQSYSSFNLPIPEYLDSGKIDIKIEALRKEYPKQYKKEKNQLYEIGKLLESAYQLAEIPEKEYERYNSELDNYYSQYQQYLINRNAVENQKKRTLKLELVVINDGTTPALDLDIFLHFPDGFNLVRKENLPIYPSIPKVPIEPMNEMQKLALTMRAPMIPHISPFNINTSIKPISNVSEPNIKKTNSFDVDIHIARIKHNLNEKLDPLYVIFDEYETAKNFKFDYKIIAENIPHPVIGSLSVIIEKNEP